MQSTLLPILRSSSRSPWSRPAILALLVCAGLALCLPGCSNDDDDDDFVIPAETSIEIFEEHNYQTGDSLYSWDAPGGVARMSLEVDDFNHGDLRIRITDANGDEILDQVYRSIDWYWYINGEYYDLVYTDSGAPGLWTIQLLYSEFQGDIHILLESTEDPVEPPDLEVDPPTTTSPLLDAAYGVDGRASFLPGTTAGKRIVLDSAGRSVVVGTLVDGSGDRDLAVWRFQSDGSADASFGTGGAFEYSGSPASGGFDLAVDGSGRILVSGWVSEDLLSTDLVLMRLDASGAVDATFGTGGEVRFDAALDEVGTAVGVDSAGRVLVAGMSQDVDSETARALVLRLDDSGTLDPGFGFGGVVQSPGPEDRVLDLDVDATDRPVLAGFQGEGMALWRLTTAGAPDPTFGGSGLVTSIGPLGELRIGRSLALAPDGSIAVTGVRFFDSTTEQVDLAAWRFDTAGAPIAVFGGNGFETYAFPNGWAVGADVEFDAAGNVLVVGRTRTVNLAETDGSATLWRFLPSGSLDGTLPESGGSGWVRFDPRDGAIGTGASALVPLISGDLLVSGAVVDQSKNSADLVVWKLQP